jgi:hypothetical protein
VCLFIISTLHERIAYIGNQLEKFENVNNSSIAFDAILSLHDGATVFIRVVQERDANGRSKPRLSFDASVLLRNLKIIENIILFKRNQYKEEIIKNSAFSS